MSDRNGTNGSWKWSRSKRSRSSTVRTCDGKRGENVSVPIEPFVGTEKPMPTRMTSPCELRCGPWLLVMMRTSWPRTRSCWYRCRTCSVTPPGFG